MAYSYYSYWHGSLEKLSELMADVRENFGKDVFIAETSYPFTTNNLDTHPNSVPNEWCDMKQDISRDGQAADFRETMETIREKIGTVTRDEIVAVANEIYGTQNLSMLMYR